ncbi:hypothetical protein ABT297_16720 [Dactylosporangium sp. NPDC000555]|uniref:hypothetical protein n=1 Tax=Dactylosporangium sp. NPDC000555 TaxID=3154260 RepID=UPI00331E8000
MDQEHRLAYRVVDDTVQILRSAATATRQAPGGQDHAEAGLAAADLSLRVLVWVLSVVSNAI